MAALTAAQITESIRALGVKEGDILLVHSSYKSLGEVDGGAATVIQGLQDAVGKEGTLVMPTFCHVDFPNSYKTWYMDKPSDVGYLTEFFRKQMYVYRSDHATHSVAARGKKAYHLTCEHGAYGPHLCPFGEYAFADSSPWMKMYREDAKIVLLGTITSSNTMKHIVEAKVAEDLLEKVKDDARREALRDQLVRFPNMTEESVWPLFPGVRMHPELLARGELICGKCGEADVYCFSAQRVCAAMYDIITENPENWFNKATLAWMAACRQAE